MAWDPAGEGEGLAAAGELELADRLGLAEGLLLMDGEDDGLGFKLVLGLGLVLGVGEVDGLGLGDAAPTILAKGAYPGSVIE